MYIYIYICIENNPPKNKNKNPPKILPEPPNKITVC